LSDLQDVQDEFFDRGVRVFGLNVPRFSESAQTLALFTEQAGLTYPVISHSGSANLIDFEGDNSFPYPRDAIVGSDGRLVYTSKNYDAQTIRRIISEQLDLRDGQ
jgi:hypothetical protein